MRDSNPPETRNYPAADSQVKLMKSLKKIVTGFFASYKFSYLIYNFLNYKKLKHNRELYKKYNIKKPVFAAVSSADFKHLPGDSPWLDKADAKKNIPLHPGFKNFNPALQNNLLTWPDNGYLILKGYFDESQCEAVNAEIDKLILGKKANYGYGSKIMFAFRQSAAIREMTEDKLLTDILDFILGKKIIPFQTINFIKGSQQKAHSDSIHMTTFPLGYLVAAWIALEDVSADNGPLFYYPGSHQLPYLLNDNYDHGGNFFRLGDEAYANYENKLEQLIAEKKLSRTELHARKGDVFLWHANLLHGGSPILNADSTRKSMVIHYYAKDVIKYHEISQRPSLM